MVFAPLASGAAKIRFTSSDSASSNLSNPTAISPVVGALSSDPPESEASIAEVLVVKEVLSETVSPASDNDVL